MKVLVESLRLIATRKDSRLVIIVATVLFLLLLLATQNAEEAFQMLALDSLSPLKRFLLAGSVFFDIHSTFTTGSLILAVLGSLLGGINLSLAYTYVKIRESSFSKVDFIVEWDFFLLFLVSDVQHVELHF